MNGISLMLVPECNFVTKKLKRIFFLISSFFGHTYQLIWTEKQGIRHSMFLNNNKKILYAAVYGFLGIL